MFCHKYGCVCCFQTLSSADGGNKQRSENDAAVSQQHAWEHCGTAGSGLPAELIHPHIVALLLETFLLTMEQTRKKAVCFPF